MTRRPGMSVTEVLVALFILALGVIAIQTMFPLAASQLLVAVREDRSALAAFNGDAALRSYWKTEVAEKVNGGTEPFFLALDNPGTNPVTGANLPAATATEISYPVIIDPMGCAARGVGTTTGPAWYGDNGYTNIRRMTLRAVDNSGNASAFALRLCSLVDGMGYDEFGRPQADREFRYNWMWIVQRTNNTNKQAANVTLVVFDKRAPGFAPPGIEESFLNVYLTPNTTSLTLPGSPDLRPGSWLMDATVETTAGGIRHANMYRVARVQLNAANNTDVDLETPIRRLDGGTNGYYGTVVIVRGVSGVYARSPLPAGE